MKAVVLEAPARLTVQSLPDPQPPSGWVRIRVGAASVCGSDLLRIYHGAARVLPIVLGHEFAGTVEAVGEGAEAWLGRRVTAAPLIPCGQCDACRRGLYACCSHYSFIGSRIDGAFADFVLAPQANLVPLPDSLSLELGALIEPLSVGFHALAQAGGAQGKTVAIIGVGSIGLLSVTAALWQGARLVIAVDIADDNLGAARELGAQLALNPRRDDVLARARALTDGVDLALEISGAPAGLEQAIMLCRAGGIIVCVGNQPLDAALPMRLIEHLMRQELALHGAWMSYSAPFPGQEWRDAVQVLAQSSERLRAMFTHETALTDLPEMFERLHQGGFSHRKVLVRY